uniref:Enoyl-CoA hydratase n=1 Tax=Bionectria ochroleuca TaxID=29856 RepID=A0A8H7KA91_BIOOC
MGKVCSQYPDEYWDLSGNTDTFNNSRESSYYSKVAALYDVIDHVPQTTVAGVDGPCFGGGVGLIFVCDIRLASPRARWTLSEIKIGVSPAVISKYLVREWGVSLAREEMLSGREIGPDALWRRGALHQVSTDQIALESLLDGYLNQLEKCAPRWRGCQQGIGPSWLACPRKYSTERLDQDNICRDDNSKV